MLSNGNTAITTSSAEPVSALTTGQATIHYLRLINGGANAGFFSVDGGQVWCRLPAKSDILLTPLLATDSQLVLVRRDSGNLSDCWAFAF